MGPPRDGEETARCPQENEGLALQDLVRDESAPKEDRQGQFISRDSKIKEIKQ